MSTTKQGLYIRVTTHLSEEVLFLYYGKRVTISYVLHESSTLYLCGMVVTCCVQVLCEYNAYTYVINVYHVTRHIVQCVYTFPYRFTYHTIPRTTCTKRLHKVTCTLGYPSYGGLTIHDRYAYTVNTRRVVTVCRYLFFIPRWIITIRYAYTFPEDDLQKNANQ
jgi:hypothetical protein